MAYDKPKQIKNTNPFTTNTLNRFFGGTYSSTDPYISGFFLIFFEHLPKELIGDDNATSVLTAISTAISVPDYAFEAVQVNALGGLKFQVPGALTIGNEFSITFTEYQYLPITNIIRNWHYGIRNNILGFSNSEVLSKDNYVQKNYKSTIYVAYLRPNMEAIEFYMAVSGAWPLNVPTDILNSDINAVEKKDPQVRFSVDLVHFDEWVADKVQSYVSAARENIDRIAKIDQQTK